MRYTNVSNKTYTLRLDRINNYYESTLNETQACHSLRRVFNVNNVYTVINTSTAHMKE